MPSFINEIKFQTSLKRKTDGITLLEIQDLSTNQQIKFGVTIDWKEVNGTIIIDHITGLEPNKKYKIKILQV